jgi:hypothetical protein
MAVIYGCAEDIILPPEEPVVGDWEGTYKVTLNYNSGGDEIVHEDSVLFYFGESNFIMSPDTLRHIDGICFCYGYGSYALTDGVRLRMSDSQPKGEIGCQSCNAEEDPDGTFRKEDQNGVLVLKQINGTTYKELRLTRVVEIE